ncbi:methyltransferase domain-containing protein [Pseudooceanicola sp. MF1-13]|uniref:methyltransferase domain-containing protein n=1 Tax=Pseudooceanicola sp. MF1-13 TaxID=3379095 RepID=UPI00389167DA
MNCRHCSTPLHRQFLDLGAAPPSNSYLTQDTLNQAETFYPLRLFVCDSCRLVQTEDFASADTYFNSDYAYFSSTSSSWLDHAKRYATAMTDRFDLNASSFVIEVASNDGYLLKNFVQAGIPCLGVEPTKSTAEAAEAIGVPTLQEFFGEDLGRKLAAEGKKADLIAGNNVYAHVPDINDFTLGIAQALKPEGVVTLEFPHLMRLVEFRQFDTVYHEHYSYLSLLVVSRIFKAAGLRVFDVEELSTHGGSLRVFGCLEASARNQSDRVDQLLTEEIGRGMDDGDFYSAFQDQANQVKDGLVRFLLDEKAKGTTIAGYGAAAKGNTLLNYAGVRPDLLPYVCDAAPSKIGKFLPGSRIPILSPDVLTEKRPDVIVILPWNIADEVMAQLSDLAEQGTRFVTAVPEIRVR